MDIADTVNVLDGAGITSVLFNPSGVDEIFYPPLSKQNHPQKANTETHTTELSHAHLASFFPDAKVPKFSSKCIMKTPRYYLINMYAHMNNKRKRKNK
jgi:hypothetical protein